MLDKNNINDIMIKKKAKKLYDFHYLDRNIKKGGNALVYKASDLYYGIK